MIEQMPPEHADGGYWYVVEAVPDPEDGGQSYGEIPGEGCCAWYGNGLVAIRCPEAVVGIETASSSDVDSVLKAAGYTTKPYGRVGGV